MNILDRAKELRKEAVADYMYLHQHPGVGFEVGETYEYVMMRLKQMGYNPKKCGKSGIIADIGNMSGKSVLLRADMDGLGIMEESGLDFASENGKMHACGHDMHTAMLLLAARILSECKINGTVRLMFQPAEEILEGSKDMMEAGVLDNPKMDAGVMLHVMTAMPFESGSVIVSSAGVGAPAADYFSVVVEGVGGHGAMPAKAVDPINISMHIFGAFENIIARELDLASKAVITIGSIACGDAYNIIPDKAIMRGTIRTYDEGVRAFVKERMSDIAENIAHSFRGKARVTFDRGCPTLLNNENLSCHIEKTMIELLDKNKVYTTKQLSEGRSDKSSGSEDFAYISHKIPSLMIGLVAGSTEKGFTYNLHHPKVRFDMDALPVGGAVYVTAALALLREEQYGNIQCTIEKDS